MADETTPPVTPPEPPTTPPEPPTRMVNDDGTFAENWHTMLKDESLHEDKTLPRIRDIENLAKSYVHVRKQVPLDKTAIPNENWTDSDWDAWYDAGGRPKTAADFNIVRPKDYPEELWDDNRAKGYQEFFHKIGLSKKQSDALVAFNNEQTLAIKQTLDQQEETEFTDLKDALHKKWGAAYDQKVHLGNIAIEKGAKGDLDYKERIIEKINADPDLIEFTSNLGSLFAEHKIVEDTQIPTPGDIDIQISKAMGKDLSPEQQKHHPYSNAQHPDHKRQVEIVKHLFEQKQKSLKTGFTG